MRERCWRAVSASCLAWGDGLSPRHHLAVGANRCGGGLAARSAGVEDGPILLHHGGRSGLLLTLLVEKAPVEGLFRSRRLSLQTIQDLLVLEHLGTLRHRALLDNVVDPIQDRVGGKLSTEIIEDPDGSGSYVVDGGSDAFLTTKPAIPRSMKAGIAPITGR